MSAFLLKRSGIAILANGLLEIAEDNKLQDIQVSCPNLTEMIKGKSEEEVFRMLNYLNAEALYYRYNDPIESNLYKEYCAPMEPYSKEQFLMSLHSFKYQCCEGPIPETSHLYHVIRELICTLDKLIYKGSEAYLSAKWDY